MKVSREDLPELVVDAAERFAAEEGLRGIVMRRIAQAVGVVPGSIYNLVGDIDEIVLRLNARMLRRLQTHLRATIDPDADAAVNALALADAYLDFVATHARAWGVILEHTMPEGEPIPEWYTAELRRTTGLADEILRPLISDADERARAVATLWAALHGLASLATSGKLAILDQHDPRAMARLLVARFLRLPGQDPSEAGF